MSSNSVTYCTIKLLLRFDDQKIGHFLSEMSVFQFYGYFTRKFIKASNLSLLQKAFVFPLISISSR